mmetsp:Transcript_17290/g.50824  ORF Transcript_17290/g.50824 Transcript_17290/m.50824 type:complete len:206 (-) Transcript_17290:477-1094(-)
MGVTYPRSTSPSSLKKLCMVDSGTSAFCCSTRSLTEMRSHDAGRGAAWLLSSMGVLVLIVWAMLQSESPTELRAFILTSYSCPGSSCRSTAKRTSPGPSYAAAVSCGKPSEKLELSLCHVMVKGAHRTSYLYISSPPSSGSAHSSEMLSVATSRVPSSGASGSKRETGRGLSKWWLPKMLECVATGAAFRPTRGRCLRRPRSGRK